MTHPYRFTLPDLSCAHCVTAVTQHLQQQFPDGRFQIDLPRKELLAQVPQVDQIAIERALAASGFPGRPLPTAGGRS